MPRGAAMLLMLYTAVALSGCSDDDPAAPADTTPPELVAVIPAGGATDVGLLQGFTFTFSERMDPATLNASTVTVGKSPGGLHLVYDRATRQLWVAPDSLWTPETTLQMGVDGATDAAGNALPPVTVEFSTGPLDCDHLVDRFEDNASTGSAASVPIDVQQPALAICGSDQDYFEFTLDESAMVTARTYITYAVDGSWSLHFLRDDGQTYATRNTSAEIGEEASFHYTFLPGTYYLQLFENNHAAHILYDLLLETCTPCQEDEYEDNDFEDNAAAISAGLHEGLRGCYMDADWFAVQVAAGQTVTLTITTEPYAGFAHRRLLIMVPGGTGAVYNGSDNPASLATAATQAGTALLCTRFWADDVVYDLEVALTD